MTREQAIKMLQFVRNALNDDMEIAKAYDMAIKALEQEPQTFKWCAGCREYDQEKHCCHRWSKVIRNTVEEMKQGRCDKCEVGNPCLYCKHGFEPQESEET